MSSSINVPDLPETDLSAVKPIRGHFGRHGVDNILRNFSDKSSIHDMQEKGVDNRMMFGINPYYMALVKGEGLTDAEDKEILPVMPPSKPLQHLVVPIITEVADISGEKDPSNQNHYSPEELKGKLLHKYDEIALGYVARACSAHCRYCYRLDLFNDSTGKGVVKPEELRDYVLNYNNSLAAGGGIDATTGEPRWPVTEILLSGGDPMVLTNRHLYKYLAASAEAGVDVIRIGTKEMAFRPMRFDSHFAETLRIFHQHYPRAHINIVNHFSHPDEFLERDDIGHYRKENGYDVWLTPVSEARRNMAQLDFVSLDNQTPVIRRVNDSVETLHLLHRALRRGGIAFKYVFQCRKIEGHNAFAVPVEESWRLHNESQKGLSDGSKSRFAMSTEDGKLEVVSVTNDLVIMKIYRSPHAAHTQGDVIIARRNPEALWFSDYKDYIVYDGRQSGPMQSSATQVNFLLRRQNLWVTSGSSSIQLPDIS